MKNQNDPCPKKFFDYYIHPKFKVVWLFNKHIILYSKVSKSYMTFFIRIGRVKLTLDIIR